jgi:hypothetical protein
MDNDNMRDAEGVAFDAGTAFDSVEHDAAAHLESIVSVLPLAEEDSAALEEGIALVFGNILAEEAANEDHALEPTYALLDELNRIWAQAA